jgi:hypothetical protein
MTSNVDIEAVVLQWCGIIGLICLSALFAGLTLGLMSLDKVGLKVRE